MTVDGATIPVTLGFVPGSVAVADVERPGLLRAGARAAAPYAREHVERHVVEATDADGAGTTVPDLVEFGFDTVDLAPLDALQRVCARVRDAGAVADDDAATIRSSLQGASLRCAGGRTIKVLHLADEGFIMRKAGPNGMAVVGPRSRGMNDHGGATSVHADQDVFGTPLTQLMDGRAPSLLRHDSPDGANRDARLMLVNLWIPLQQITQPLVLADGRSIDRRRHQLRYGLATDTFLDREDDMAAVKAAHLVPKRALRVKFIASGTLDKAVTVSGLKVTAGGSTTSGRSSTTRTSAGTSGPRWTTAAPTCSTR